MSKRFEVLFYGDVINCVKDENGKEYNLQEIISILMNQQATITELEKEVNLLRPTNLEQYEQIQKLQKENEQLKEQVKRLQDIGTRTEAEKEKYADLYCKYENELIKNGRRCDGVKDE